MALRPTRIVCTVLALLFVSGTFTPKPARAAPTGKLWTFYIIAGGAVLYYGIKLLVDNSNANRDGRRANEAMNMYTPNDAVVTDTDVAKFLDAVSWSELRTAVIGAVWVESRNRDLSVGQQWNQMYETAQPPPPAPTPAFVASGGASPAPSASPNVAATGPITPVIPAGPNPRPSGAIPPPPPKPSPGAIPPPPSNGSPPSGGVGPSGKPAGGTSPKALATPSPRDLFEQLASCTNALVYVQQSGGSGGQSQSANKLDCTTWLNKDSVGKTLIDQSDAQAAFTNALPIEQQITAASVDSYSTQNRLRLRVVKLLAIRFLQQVFPGNAGGGGTGGTTFSLQDFITNCATSSSLSVTGCLPQIGAAETEAASAHRSKVACSFAEVNYMPMYSAITDNGDPKKAVTYPGYPNGAESGSPWGGGGLTLVDDPKTITVPDYGPVPGC
jgi:hypothetical protein